MMKKSDPTPQQSKKVDPTPQQLKKVDPTPQQSKKVDPAPQQSKKVDPAPQQSKKVAPQQPKKSDTRSQPTSKALSARPSGELEPEKSRLQTWMHRTALYTRFWQANAVLFLDDKLKRDPKVGDRLKYLRAQFAGLQLLMKNPAYAKRLPPGGEQQLRYMGPAMSLMEKAIKDNPDLKMSEVKQMARDPERAQQQMTPRMRTRPGPPIKGRRKH